MTMCEDCEEALATVHVRKLNRHGWRPPAAAATTPHLDDGRAAPIEAFACEPAASDAAAKVNRCA